MCEKHDININIDAIMLRSVLSEASVSPSEVKDTKKME